MEKKTASAIMLTLLLTSMLTLAFNIQLVKAEGGTIYIRSDGSVDPPTAPIQRNGDFYTLTGNITSDTDGIVIGRDNITLDGAGYTVQGAGAETGIDLTGRSNVTVKNMEIKNFSYGIYLSGSSNNSVSGNNIQANNANGIHLYCSSSNSIFHNNFVNNNIQVYSSGPANIWDDGYPSGGNYWSDYAGVDFCSGSYQNESGSDGMGDTPYVIDEDNQDNYPLMKPYPWYPHDVGITSVTTSKNIVGQGYTASINVMIFNCGNDTETFNVTIYANQTIIGEIYSIDLTSRNSTTLTLTWNTSGFVKGNYTISAYAWPVPGETDTADNNVTDGVVLVTLIGDVNGDGKVRVDDILAVAQRFGTNYGGPPNSNGFYYDANCDVNDDLKIRIDDVLAAATHFGQGPW